MTKNKAGPNQARQLAPVRVARVLAVAMGLAGTVRSADAQTVDSPVSITDSATTAGSATDANTPLDAAELDYASPRPALLMVVEPAEPPTGAHVRDEGDPKHLAQFQLPPTTPEIGAPARPAVQFLTFQYAYGSESKIEYRSNRDLDRRVADNNLIITPQVNGIVLYRPTDWLETTLEMILEKEIPVNEKHRVVLPSGDIQRAPKRRASFLVDQAFVRVHNVIAPFDVSVGRKNYEDERHWLYDTSMDMVSAGMKLGQFRGDFTAGREVYKDLDYAPSKREQKDRVDTRMFYADYRLEDVRLAAYTIQRDDRARRDGRARLMGVRALGVPSDNLNYWTEAALLRGSDERSRKLQGYGFDVGFTYRLLDIENHPNFTLSYALGSGEGRPNDRTNTEFRQSGLQSNETRLGGVSKFKIYGEALDPELSNLKILTVGTGFRPAPTVSVDVVFHHYRLHRHSDQLRASALTGEINQIDGRSSKTVGNGIDLVVGFRRIFGLRLGLDLRGGVFFPGRAYELREGTNRNPIIRHGNKAYAFVAKIWW